MSLILITSLIAFGMLLQGEISFGDDQNWSLKGLNFG